MVEDRLVFTLHKYYLAATTMKHHFEETIKKGKNNRVEAEMYMNLWYACLYVVIEGWNELSLEDEQIDQILSSTNVDYLKRYRNGVFHFQKDYYSNRIEDFLFEAENPVDWIRRLNLELGRFFFYWFEKK